MSANKAEVQVTQKLFIDEYVKMGAFSTAFELPCRFQTNINLEF